MCIRVATPASVADCTATQQNCFVKWSHVRRCDPRLNINSCKCWTIYQPLPLPLDALFKWSFPIRVCLVAHGQVKKLHEVHHPRCELQGKPQAKLEAECGCGKTVLARPSCWTYISTPIQSSRYTSVSCFFTILMQHPISNLLHNLTSSALVPQFGIAGSRSDVLKSLHWLTIDQHMWPTTTKWVRCRTYENWDKCLWSFIWQKFVVSFLIFLILIWL